MNTVPGFLSRLVDKIEKKCLIPIRLRLYISGKQSKNRVPEVTAVLNSKFFDAQYYRETYQLDFNDLSLAAYYTYIGFRQGHNPSPSFSGEGYYWLRPDVKKLGQNPLAHYEFFGFREGVRPLSTSEFEQNKDLDDDIAAIETVKKQRKVALLVSHEMSLTGAPRALLNLAVTLKSLGVEPVFAMLIPGELEEEVRRAGLRCRLLMMQGMSGDPDFAAKVSKFVSLFDLILFNTIVALPLVENIRTLALPKVCWIHDGSYGFGCCPASPRFAALYPLYDKIFVVGDYAKQIALSYSDRNVEMENLYYGIGDLHHKSCGQTEHTEVRMIIAGTVDKRKGQDVLLDSLSLLAPEILRQLKIFVIGKAVDSEISNRLRQNAYGSVEMLGAIPHEQVLDYFMQMDILVCPSIDDPMPIVCTEALMLSKPVIVSDHTGTASLIKEGNNGYVIKAGDAQSLADAILKSVKAKSELPSMGKRARLVYEKYFTNEVFERNVKEKLLPLLR